MEATALATSRLLDEVPRLKWVHQIDLGQGVKTPGLWPPRPLIAGALDRIDLAGKKVLDVGCWDGLWTFEAERRGAREVVAIDSVSQRPLADQPTFDLARRILNSGARYYPDLSVYDVPSLGETDFDVILYCGVYYHLKDPLRSLAQLRKVLKPGGLLVVEGEVLFNDPGCHARFFYRDHHCHDPSNWWVPTIPCLRQWVECSTFEILWDDDDAPPTKPGPLARFKRWVKGALCYPAPATSFSRHLIVARASAGPDPHYLFPDEDLAMFQSNVK